MEGLVVYYLESAFTGFPTTACHFIDIYHDPMKVAYVFIVLLRYVRPQGE